MREAALRMSSQVNNLLDMARLQSGQVQLQPAVAAARGSGRQRACAPWQGTLDPRRVRVSLAAGPAAAARRRGADRAGACATCWRTPPSTRRRARRSRSTRAVVGDARRGDGRRPRARPAARPRGGDLPEVRARPQGERHARRRPGPGDLPRHRRGARRHASRGETRPGGGARFTIDLPRGEPPTRGRDRVREHRARHSA